MKWLLFFLIVLILIFVMFNSGSGYDENSFDNIIKIGDISLNAYIVDSDIERMKGLSGVHSIKEDDGMLFVFEKEGYHGIWMKDMNFPIDIAWIDKDMNIIHIEKNVSTSTYPKVFSPTDPSLFVLETNSHFFEKNKIKIGDQIDL